MMVRNDRTAYVEGMLPRMRGCSLLATDAGKGLAALTRIIGISAFSLAGMKKNARTTTRAAMTICRSQVDLFQ